MGGLRRGLIRAIRYFILKPVALIGWLAGLVIVVGLIVVGVMFAPSLPVIANMRGPLAPTSTEDYLRGNRDYNADLIWNSLDTDAQARLTAGGGSRDDLQTQMDTARQKGIQLAETSYIGGKSLPDGTSMQFYLVGVRQQAGSSIDYQPYMFTLDRDGKIAKVQ